MREIAVRDGIDAATTLLYRSVLESPVHGPFIKRIGEICRRPAPAAWKRDAVLVIVPGAFYRENPGCGSDGRLFREQAERLGCPTDLIPIASLGSVGENARIICDWLAEHRGRPVILASLSKGGADVKMALAEPAAASAFENVAAWISLCGILDGTPMADWLLSWNPGAVMTRLYNRLRGQGMGFLRDLRYGAGRTLACELRLPEHVRMIDVVGFPLREHLVRGIARRCHRRLEPLGPNDGGLVLADVCARPGLVYPVWGADHYLQPKSDLRELILALLQYLDESLPWEPEAALGKQAQQGPKGLQGQQGRESPGLVGDLRPCSPCSPLGPLPAAPFLAWPGWAHLCYAALLSAANTLWFCVVYGGADWLTARRSLRVPVDLPGELRIPFVPAMTLFYMSLYALFLAAPFILRGRRELRALVLTMAVVIFCGGIGFLLIPAQLAFAPPAVGELGRWAGLFRFADDLNLTYNLLPSLHVAFAVVCVAVFSRRASGPGKLLLWAWAALIAASTVLIHQHHVLDVATGWLLALASVRFVFDRLGK